MARQERSLVVSTQIRYVTFVTGASCRRQRSQGGVQVPTGGNCLTTEARERFKKAVMTGSDPGRAGMKVSRSGVIPEPTVIVRMKESGLSSI